MADQSQGLQFWANLVQIATGLFAAVRYTILALREYKRAVGLIPHHSDVAARFHLRVEPLVPADYEDTLPPAPPSLSRRAVYSAMARDGVARAKLHARLLASAFLRVLLRRLG